MEKNSEITKIEEVGYPRSLITRNNIPTSELIETEDLILEVSSQISKKFALWLINNYTFISSTKDFVIKYPYLRESNEYIHFKVDELWEHYLTLVDNPIHKEII